MIVRRFKNLCCKIPLVEASRTHAAPWRFEPEQASVIESLVHEMRGPKADCLKDKLKSYKWYSRQCYLWEIYAAAEPEMTGRATLPVLLDSATGRIYNNNHSEILQVFNDSAEELGGSANPSLLPAKLKKKVWQMQKLIVPGFNQSIYKMHHAPSDQEFEAAKEEVLCTMASMDEVLRETPFLAGHEVTILDVQVFPMLARFEVAFETLFRGGVGTLGSFPELFAYYRRLWQMPLFKADTDFGAYLNYFQTAGHYPFLLPPGTLSSRHRRQWLGTLVRFWRSLLFVYMGAAPPDARVARQLFRFFSLPFSLLLLLFK